MTSPAHAIAALRRAQHRLMERSDLFAERDVRDAYDLLHRQELALRAELWATWPDAPLQAKIDFSQRVKTLAEMKVGYGEA